MISLPLTETVRGTGGTPADGEAVNHNGQQLQGGSLLDVEDRLAAK